jgi:MIP family channel proteins
LKAHLAEFFGTALLVMFAASAVVGTALAFGTPSALVCGLSSGAILAAVIIAFGRVSGAHVNPAFTIGLAYLGRFSWAMVPGYVAAQLAGSACGGLIVLWLLGDGFDAGANVPNVALGVSTAMAFVFETILSFIMMMTILLCGDADEGFAHAGAIRIGAIVGIEVMLFGPIGGAAMNPARAFGPYLARGDWTEYWAYVAGPMLGIMSAAIIHKKTAAWLRDRVEASCK